jgi:hypothetical protein
MVDVYELSSISFASLVSLLKLLQWLTLITLLLFERDGGGNDDMNSGISGDSVEHGHFLLCFRFLFFIWRTMYWEEYEHFQFFFSLYRTGKLAENNVKLKSTYGERSVRCPSRSANIHLKNIQYRDGNTCTMIYSNNNFI